MCQNDTLTLQHQTITAMLFNLKNKRNTEPAPSLRGHYEYEYPHPALTCDCVVFGFDGFRLHILCIERGLEPFKGFWALPGGFCRPDETIEQCAARELAEETNISEVYLRQFHVFSRPDRDPRERVVTVAFLALIRPSDFDVAAGDDAANTHWFRATQLPPLAFDHQEIVDKAREVLGLKLQHEPLAFRLLEQNFTMPELQRLYEEALGEKFDRRNFARKMQASGVIDTATPCPTDTRGENVREDCQDLPSSQSILPHEAGRKASSLTFNPDKYQDQRSRKGSRWNPFSI